MESRTPTEPAIPLIDANVLAEAKDVRRQLMAANAQVEALTKENDKIHADRVRLADDVRFLGEHLRHANHIIAEQRAAVADAEARASRAAQDERSAVLVYLAERSRVELERCRGDKSAANTKWLDAIFAVKDIAQNIEAGEHHDDPAAPPVAPDSVAPEPGRQVLDQRRWCTCTGQCKGVGGLAPGWLCQKCRRGPTDTEVNDYRAAIVRVAPEPEQAAGACPRCDGEGQVEASGENPCGRCGGTGVAPEPEPGHDWCECGDAKPKALTMCERCLPFDDLGAMAKYAREQWATRAAQPPAAPPGERDPWSAQEVRDALGALRELLLAGAEGRSVANIVDRILSRLAAEHTPPDRAASEAETRAQVEREVAAFLEAMCSPGFAGTVRRSDYPRLPRPEPPELAAICRCGHDRGSHGPTGGPCECCTEPGGCRCAAFVGELG